MRHTIVGLLAGVAILALPIAANATTTFVSLGNFDAVNDTDGVAHGFEIELEGIHASNVTDTFGGVGRGFPTTVERYDCCRALYKIFETMLKLVVFGRFIAHVPFLRPV